MRIREMDWTPLILTGAGFLLSVLWFDLKFDLLAFEAWQTGSTLIEAHLASIKAYYQRALAAEQNGFPLIVTMMGLTIAGLALQLYSHLGIAWIKIVSLMLGVAPISLAGVRVVPMANELAASEAALEVQATMATSILVDHMICFACIGSLILLQVWLWVSRQNN